MPSGRVFDGVLMSNKMIHGAGGGKRWSADCAKVCVREIYQLYGAYEYPCCDDYRPANESASEQVSESALCELIAVGVV